MFKAVDKWFPGYLRSLLRRPRAVSGTRHLIFCVCDHYEPFRDGAEAATARNTVQDWLSAYPAAIDPFRDADGRRPRHTFFYPQEEYDESILDRLGDFCRRGFGEVEIHLHHRHDTAEGFREKLVTFRDRLHERHGLLGVDSVKCRVPSAEREDPGGVTNVDSQLGAPCSLLGTAASVPAARYGFIHGNWALCNSRPDGDWCGVNEELGILAETGCYADFTFPSAPSPTQPRMVNALYYAQDAPGQPRGADRGELSSCQAAKLLREHPSGEPIATQQLNNVTTAPKLLLITGPLALNGARRKWGLFPRLENAGITGVNPPTSDRVRLWARQGIHVMGLPEWVFVKVHTHGCVPGNAGVILGEAMRQAHETLKHEFNDGQDWKLHYVTAREMYNLVKAAEAGATGEPEPWRDFKVAWVH